MTSLIGKAEISKAAKLPKLVITKFNGTLQDWLRFWNQFEAEIDKSQVASVTKFSYLKELVEPKVRSTIDGVPFCTEGCERAKSILKSKHGKPCEIVHAYVQNIMSLPTITGSQPKKVHEFYEILVYNGQSLETLGKLREITGYVRTTLDKLEGIRGDLVRNDSNWQEWDFPMLVESLRLWTERNPVPNKDSESRHDLKPAHQSGKHGGSRDRAYHAKQNEVKRTCVYCDSLDYRSKDCDKIVSVGDRRKFLQEKHLCFNCAGSKHLAADCKSKTTCANCGRRHHTSICSKVANPLLRAPISKERQLFIQW